MIQAAAATAAINGRHVTAKYDRASPGAPSAKPKVATGGLRQVASAHAGPPGVAITKTEFEGAHERG